MTDKGKNTLDKAMSVANGLADIGASSIALSRIEDTGSQWADINQTAGLGNRSYAYGSFTDLNNDYRMLDSLPSYYDTKDFRGFSDEQIAGNILTGSLSGAAAGSVFGPVGTAVGAALGLGAGIWGAAAGNKAAKDEQNALTLGAEYATDTARQNLSAASESMLDRKSRTGKVNAVAAGGKIERKTVTAKEFAERVLSRKNERSSTAPALIRKKCNGGVMIRLKK